MKNLRQKFGKFAISGRKANSMTGGWQPFVWCRSYFDTNSGGRNGYCCRLDYATASQDCACPNEMLCTPLYKEYN